MIRSGCAISRTTSWSCHCVRAVIRNGVTSQVQHADPATVSEPWSGAGVPSQIRQADHRLGRLHLQRGDHHLLCRRSSRDRIPMSDYIKHKCNEGEGLRWGELTNLTSFYWAIHEVNTVCPWGLANATRVIGIGVFHHKQVFSFRFLQIFLQGSSIFFFSFSLLSFWIFWHIHYNIQYQEYKKKF